MRRLNVMRIPFWRKIETGYLSFLIPINLWFNKLKCFCFSKCISWVFQLRFVLLICLNVSTLFLIWTLLWKDRQCDSFRKCKCRVAHVWLHVLIFPFLFRWIRDEFGKTKSSVTCHKVLTIDELSKQWVCYFDCVMYITFTWACT